MSENLSPIEPLSDLNYVPNATTWPGWPLPSSSLSLPLSHYSYSSYEPSMSNQHHHPYPEVMLPTGTGRADLKKLHSYQKNDRKVLDHARKLFMATTRKASGAGL